MILRLILILLLVAPAAFAQEAVSVDDDREPYHDPGWAALRGAFVPGSVHLQHGESTRGTVYLVGALIALPFALGVVEVPFLDDPDFSQAIGIGLYAMDAGISAYESAELVDRLNRENGYLLDVDLSRFGPPPAREVRVTLLQARF